MEDTCPTERFLSEHGLSFYIETGSRRLLFDTGATDAFLLNAERMGLDLCNVDTVILSHGHYDHTGGVTAFAKRNPKARIYLRAEAVGAYYNCRYEPPKYIGMDAQIAALANVVFLDGDAVLSPTITVFSGISEKILVPRGNKTLTQRSGDAYLPDPFLHEQYLAITEGDRHILFSGCAHNGILSILAAYHQKFGRYPTHVISGFHTTKADYTSEDDALIRETAVRLSAMPTQFYTGHCTGEYAIRIIEPILGEQLHILHSGDRIL